MNKQINQTSKDILYTMHQTAMLLNKAPGQDDDKSRLAMEAETEGWFDIWRADHEKGIDRTDEILTMSKFLKAVGR